MQKRLGVVAGLTCLLALQMRSAEVAAQEQLQAVTTRDGIGFSIPGHMVHAPDLKLLPGVNPLPELSFTDGQESPVQLLVFRGPAKANTGLPPSSDKVPRQYAMGFAEGLRLAMKLPEIYEVKPGRYDQSRGAFSLSFKARSDSKARGMLDESDSGQFWTQVRQSGGDAKRSRCLLTHLLGGARSVNEAQLRGNHATTAERCGITVKELEAYVSALGTSMFAPYETMFMSTAFFTKSALLVTLIAAPMERASDAQALSDLIWANATVSPEVRIQGSSIAGQSGFSPLGVVRLVSVAIGSVLAVLLIGGFLAWVLSKVGVSIGLAVAISFATLVGLVLLGIVLGGSLTMIGGAQLGCYVLASLVTYRPMTKWLAKRQLGPTPSQLSESRGR